MQAGGNSLSEMDWRATIVTVACVMGAIGCAPQDNNAIGGTIELIPKSGLLTSKGLRVRGNDLTPANGRTRHLLTAERLPLSGNDWPYIVELRFKNSEDAQSLRLSPTQKRQILVNLRVTHAKGDHRLSGTLFDNWLSPSGEDSYYYLNPSVPANSNRLGLYLSEQQGIELDVEIFMKNDLAERVLPSVSLRTGGTK